MAEVLLAECERLPEELQGEIERLAEISRRLRRDRELAFYGTEDITASHFYRESDATRAHDSAAFVVHVVCPQSPDR